MKDLNILTIEEIRDYIKDTENLVELRESLDTLHSYDLAKIFQNLTDYELVKFYSIFKDEEIGEILSFIDSEDVVEIFEDLNTSKIASIINTMEPDDAIDIIQEFDEEKQESIINLLDEEQKQDITYLSTYDENTAGAMMNSNFISITKGSDVKKIMKEIVSKAPDVESITTSFVVDENNYLLGTLELKKIIITKSPHLVDDIMNQNYISINVNDSLDYALSIIQKYDIYELPVLDNGILKGIITMDDAIDTFYEESEDDYIKFAGVSETTESDEKIIISVKNRLPWLALLLFLNIVIAFTISRFDYLFEIDALTILVIFQPIILGIAGNCGTQSLAVTISEITKNELTTNSRTLTHILKEFLLGLSTGIIFAILASIISYIFLNLNGSTLNSINLMLTISIAILASITSANFFGAFIPIFLYKIKLNPATASGPLITTLIDVLAIVIYYVLATILLYNKLI